MGTALNKSMKDTICRFYRKIGYNVFDRPGFDMHGLPIEQKVEKILGINKKEIEKIGIKNFVNKCREFSYGNMYNMIEEFKRMGVWMDWDNPYMTISNEYIERIWMILKKAYEKELIYEDKKVVHWCPRCQTALAKHEIEQGYNDPEYKPAIDPSIFVKFKLKDKENTYLLIWTTTPWTLTFNMGVMVNPNVEYVLVEVPKVYVKSISNNESELVYKNEREYWIVAKDLLEKVMNKLKIKDYKVVDTFLGKELEGLEYVHPFYEELKKELEKIKRENPNAFKIWLSEEYVSTEEGTGLVHAAPGCGPEDFEVGKRYGVKAWNTTDEIGNIVGLKEFEGWKAKKDDMKWINKLIDKKILVYFELYKHDYPICWRCKERIIFRLTKQWYINVHKIKSKMLEENEKIRWIPPYVRKAFENVIQSAPDWVISRQRFWGIPIPIWRCKNGHSLVIGSRKELEKYTGKKFVNIYIVVKKSEYAKKLLNWMFKNIKSIEKEEIKAEDIKNINEDTVIFVKKFDEDELKKLKDYYYLKASGENYDLYRIYNYDLHIPWVDSLEIKCPVCNEKMERVIDVLDVWIDSGGAFYAVFEGIEEVKPVDFILEGYDQLRGWFYSLLVEGVIFYDRSPYNTVYVHGFTLDALGRKMSKSLGNVVFPREIYNRFGSDTLRLYLVGATGPYEDLNFYIEDVKTKYNNLNVLWNIHRYLIEQCRFYNINPLKIKEEDLKFDVEEKYILSLLNRTLKELKEEMLKFNVYNVPRLLENLWLELSREYIKSVREKIQYGDDIQRKTAIWTIYKVLFDTVNALSIVCPFITEKIYQNLKKEFGLKEESIHLLEFPEIKEEYINEELENKYKVAREIVEKVLRIRNKISYGVRWPLKKLLIYSKYNLEEFKEFLKKRCNVKEVIFLKELPDLEIKVIVKGGVEGFDKIKEIIDKEKPKELLSKILEKGYLKFEDILITRDILKFEIKERGGEKVEIFSSGIVILDTRIDKELMLEGYLREFVRRVQEMRKKMGLVKKDKIILGVVTDKEVLDYIKKNLDRIREVIGIKEFLDKEIEEYDHKEKIRIRDKEFDIWIKRI